LDDIAPTSWPNFLARDNMLIARYRPSVRHTGGSFKNGSS